MAKTNITDFEDSLEKKRSEYFSCLQDTFTLLNKNPSYDIVQKEMTSLHSKGVNYFNLFERSIDEYGLPYFELNQDTKNRKIEDAEGIVDVIINHWTTLRMISEKYDIVCPSPSTKSYSSIQRLLKHFQHQSIIEIKDKFMNSNLPTNGFDSKETFSGWKIGSRNLTITQITIGLIFTIVTGILIFKYNTLTGMQYMFCRIGLVTGITLIGSALIEGTVNINWTLQKSLTIKAVGWIGVFILLLYRNMPSAPTP